MEERRSISAEIRELVVEAARAAADKKANHVLILDMREVATFTDYFLICSGNNDKQVAKIQEAVERRLINYRAKPARREGERYRRWVLLDYIDFVVHIFLQEDRDYYELERLWKDAPVVDWEAESQVFPAKAGI